MSSRSEKVIVRAPFAMRITPSVEVKEHLINSEVPSGTGMCRHFSNRQLIEKWNKVKAHLLLCAF